MTTSTRPLSELNHFMISTLLFWVTCFWACLGGGHVYFAILLWLIFILIKSNFAYLFISLFCNPSPVFQVP